MDQETRKARVADLHRQHPNWGSGRISSKLGIGRTRVQEILTGLKSEGLIPSADELESQSFDQSGESGVLTSKSFSIKTVKDALRKAEVDEVIWDVDRFVVNSWEVAMKLKTKEGDKPVTRLLWQVKVWLRRKVTQAVEIAASALWERMKNEAPRLPVIKYRKPTDPHLLEISPFDVHFGKLAWGRETGEDYDLQIAEERFRNTFEKLLAQSAHQQVEKILVPLGNDFLHIDTPLNTTGHGTPQDVDGRYPKLIETAAMAMVRAIESCRTVAPVEVLWVPGNHDPRTSWHVAQFLWAWFRNTEGVTVEHGSQFRKYFSYGVTLLGFTHGNEEAHRDLPTIMAGEVPKQWAAAKYREWHLGHFHKAKQTHYASGDTFGPCIVRVLPSISGTDAWHYRRGYVKGTRGAEAFLYSKSEGMVASFFAAI